jgi:hypothetical protein
MAISQGVIKQTRFKRQTAKGTIATTGAGQILRRTSSVFELVKEIYDTNSEISSTQQMITSRHGVRSIQGKISGLLSPGTYSDLLSAVLRRDFAAVAAITGASITIAGSGPTYTVTRAAGSFLTDGIKVGQVVRLSAGAFNAANLSKNLLVTIVTATVLTVLPVNGVALVAEGPIATSTVTAIGKVTYIPITGHTNIYYTFEEWASDVPASEQNQDVKISKASIKIPGTGNATIDIDAVGLNQLQTAGVYFSSPTAETSSGVVNAAGGLLLVNGVTQASVTDLSFEIDGQEKPADGAVGSNVRPDIFRGKVLIKGSFTAYFDSTTLRDLFINETNVTLLSVLTADNTAAADFISFMIPQLNCNSSTPTDGETGLKRSYNFTAEYNAAGGAGISTEQTTMTIQDSLA